MELTKTAINEGKCVVIGLQSTGDSRTKSEVLRQHDQSFDSEDENEGSFYLRLSYEGIRFVDGFVSSPKAILFQLLEKAFPTIMIPDHLIVSNHYIDTKIGEIPSEYSMNDCWK